MEALAFMADGDETVIPLLQRWGGYALVGKLLDQCFLFIQGKSGTAKSAFSDILIRLMGSYGTPGSTTLFMKQSDKRSFELGDIAGKRGLFVPETKKGSKRSVKDACRWSPPGAMIGAWQRQQRKCPLSA